MFFLNPPSKDKSARGSVQLYTRVWTERRPKGREEIPVQNFPLPKVFNIRKFRCSVTSDLSINTVLTDGGSDTELVEQEAHNRPGSWHGECVTHG